MAKGVRGAGNKAKDRQHSRHKVKYERQRIRTEANKVRRRRKHLIKHPNDFQAKEIYKLKNFRV